MNILSINLQDGFADEPVTIRVNNREVFRKKSVKTRLLLGYADLFEVQVPAGSVNVQDRYSERIFLSYGKDGFYFAQPGEYQIRAVYQGTGEILIPSNVHRIRIGNPLYREDDRIAQDFFTHQVGMSLYLGGSQSSFLKKGMDVLEEVADRYKDTFLGAKAATTLANSIAHSFFRVQDGALTNTHSADPETALKLTEPALTLYKREKSKSRNIAYHQLVSERAQYLVKLGKNEAAKQEMSTLRQDLAARGVKEAVLNEIKVKEDTLKG